MISGYLIFCSSSTAMIHNFGDHRLRTHGDRRFTSATTDYARAWRTPLYRPAIMLAFFKNGDDAYLRRPPTTHAWKAPLYRPAIILAFHVSSSTSPLTSNIWTSVLLRQRWCTASATTDYARTEIAATSTGDHVGLLQHGDDAYLRRPPTTHEWRAPLYRLAIILAFHVSSSTSPLTSNELLFFKDGDDAPLRRPPTTHAWRTPLYRPTIMLAFFKNGDDAYLRRPPTTLNLPQTSPTTVYKY